MFPFQPNDDWYERQWYAAEPVRVSWRAPALLVSVAALMLAVWIG
jgi:hypothetical protein